MNCFLLDSWINNAIYKPAARHIYDWYNARLNVNEKIGTIILITLGNFLKENTAKHAKNIAKQSTSASNIYVQNKDVNVTFEPNKIATQIPCTLLKLKSLATNNTAMDTYKILDIPINQGVAKSLLLSKKG